MPYNFFPWIDDAKVPNNLNLNNGTDFVSNEEREEGFKPNTIARSSSANSGLRQANLVVAALMKVASGALLSPSSPAPSNLDLTSKIDDVATAIKELGSNLLVRFEMANNRTNVASGDSLSTILSKIGKYFNDLQSFAFNSIQTSQSTSLNAPTTKLLMESSFSKVYRSIASVSSSITASSTISTIFSAMSNNSYLIANTSGYTDSSLQPDQETSGILEIIKLDNNNGLTRFTVYKSSSLTVSYYSSFTTSGGFSSWQKTVDSSDITELHGEIDSFVLANNKIATDGLTFTYDDTNGTAVCTGGSVSGDIVIPAYVKNNGKWYKVTKIGDNAFQNNTNITYVIIPISVWQIGNHAFQGCTSLSEIGIWTSASYDYLDCEAKEMYFGEYAFSETAIMYVNIKCLSIRYGNHCFQNCTKLVRFEDKSNRSYYAYRTFYGCTALTTVNLQSVFTYLYRENFYGCSSLRNITFNENVLVDTYLNLFRNTSNLTLTVLHKDDQSLSSNDKRYLINNAVTLVEYFRTKKKYIHSVRLQPNVSNATLFSGNIKIINDDPSEITNISTINGLTEGQILSVSGFVWEDGNKGYPATKHIKYSASDALIIRYASSFPMTAETSSMTLQSNSTSSYDFSDIVYEL